MGLESGRGRAVKRGAREMSKEQTMAKTKTTRYDVAEHLRTPEEMAAYLKACFEVADSDTTFIAKALDDIARAIRIVQKRRL